jgi:hypothetical protein
MIYKWSFSSLQKIIYIIDNLDICYFGLAKRYRQHQHTHSDNENYWLVWR